jgi:hypothetical protein
MQIELTEGELGTLQMGLAAYHDWLKTQLRKGVTGDQEYFMAEVGRVSRAGATLNAAARKLQPAWAVEAA